MSHAVPGPSSSSAGYGGFAGEAADYDSTFEEDYAIEDSEAARKRAKYAKRQDLARKPATFRAPKPKKEDFVDEAAKEGNRVRQSHFMALSAYDRHKELVNNYFLYFSGATKDLARDTSRDRTDLDVIKENHKFLWDDDEEGEEMSWGQRIAKKYYEKLFKEYCITDLSRYKENKVAMRWRIEKEVVAGKGQFTCGARKCEEKETLRTWEVNFGYVEQGEKKNALVKVRLCPDCSYKLNYHHKKKEVTKKPKKRKKGKKKKDKKDRKRSHSSSSSSEEESQSEELEREKNLEAQKEEDKKLEKKASEIWSAPIEVEQEKSREEDFSEYLEDLFM